MNAKIVRI